MDKERLTYKCQMCAGRSALVEDGLCWNCAWKNLQQEKFEKERWYKWPIRPIPASSGGGVLPAPRPLIPVSTPTPSAQPIDETAKTSPIGNGQRKFKQEEE